jgi:ABC-type transport system involved in multi-copper enzyme maturation permease subunit
LREAVRRKIVLAALAMGGLFLTVYAVGFYFMNKDVQQHSNVISIVAMKEVRNFFLLAGLYVVNFLTIAMAVLTSIDTLSGEISSGTVQTLVAKPVSRWQIVLGKWIGFVLLLTAYLLLMAGGVMAIVLIISGQHPPRPFLGLSLVWLNGLLLLSLSFFGGSRLSTLANGVLAFGLYGIGFVGGWIEQFGWLAGKTAAVNVGIVASLIFPGEAVWKRAAFELQSPLVKALGLSPFTSASPPNAMMIAYAVLYAAVILSLAVHKFSRRDL